MTSSSMNMSHIWTLHIHIWHAWSILISLHDEFMHERVPHMTIAYSYMTHTIFIHYMHDPCMIINFSYKHHTWPIHDLLVWSNTGNDISLPVLGQFLPFNWVDIGPGSGQYWIPCLGQHCAPSLAQQHFDYKAKTGPILWTNVAPINSSTALPVLTPCFANAIQFSFSTASVGPMWCQWKLQYCSSPWPMLWQSTWSLSQQFFIAGSMLCSLTCQLLLQQFFRK